MPALDHSFAYETRTLPGGGLRTCSGNGKPCAFMIRPGKPNYEPAASGSRRERPRQKILGRSTDADPVHGPHGRYHPVEVTFSGGGQESLTKQGKGEIVSIPKNVWKRVCWEPVDKIPNLNIAMALVAKCARGILPEYPGLPKTGGGEPDLRGKNSVLDSVSAISDPMREAPLGAAVTFPKNAVPPACRSSFTICYDRPC